MKRLILWVGMVAVVLMGLSSHSAFGYLIDGYLDDWGVTPGLLGSSDWEPNPGVYYTVQDYTDSPDFNTYLGPGYGGQTFEAEAMYMGFDNNNLYYAIVTGFPTYGADGYLPGDIAFNFRNEGYKYGIGVPEFPSFIPPAHQPQAGGLYNVAPWNWDWNWWDSTIPTKINWVDGINTYLITSGSLVYNNLYYSTYDHWVIEGSIPISGFSSDWGKPFIASWTQTCGNHIIVDPAPIPEPTSLLLLGTGLLGFAGFKKFRRKG